MSIGGQNVVNLLQSVNQVVGFAKKPKKNPVNGFCDNFILKLHHTYAYYFFISLHLLITLRWWSSDALICSNKFNGDAQIHPDLMNICYTYLYLPEAGDGRRYLFWYRYINFILLAVAGLYYWIHKVSKCIEDPATKNLLTEIQPISGTNIKPDENLDEVTSKNVPKYLTRTMGFNQSIYLKNLALTVLCLAINLLVFFGLDYSLSGRYLTYVFKIFPFERDMEQFSDYMSRTFPPFGECQIKSIHKLVSERTEVYGCHMTHMELFEKVFAVYWLMLVFLMAASVVYIFYLVSFNFPRFRTFYNETYSTPASGFDDDGEKMYHSQIKKFTDSLNVSDSYVLCRLRAEMTEMRFFIVLLKMLPKEESAKTEPTKRNKLPTSVSFENEVNIS